jgi:hypothetical protein
MRPETMVNSWLPIWLRGVGLDLTPAADWSNWVSELEERARLEHMALYERIDGEVYQAIEALLEETVPIIVGSLPPATRERVRQRQQASLDAVSAAIHVWALDAADMLQTAEADLEKWRWRRDTVASLAMRVEELQDSPAVSVLRDSRRSG